MNENVIKLFYLVFFKIYPSLFKHKNSYTDQTIIALFSLLIHKYSLGNSVKVLCILIFFLLISFSIYIMYICLMSIH
jgi:hypothetical protein